MRAWWLVGSLALPVGALALLPGEAGTLAWRAGGVTAAAALVLALVLAGRRTRSARRPVIRVTARAALGRAATVAVVEVDGRRFLVGSGDRTLELLSELSPATLEAEP